MANDKKAALESKLKALDAKRVKIEAKMAGLDAEPKTVKTAKRGKKGG